jgi:PEP-CTERM motif
VILMMRFPLSVGSSRYFYLHMIEISVHHLAYHAELNSKSQTVKPDCDARSKRCRPNKTLDSWTKGDADKAGLPLQAGLSQQISAQDGRRCPWRSKPSGIPTGETFDIVGAGDGLTNRLTSLSLDGRACGTVGDIFKCNARSFFDIFSLSVVPGMLADGMNSEDLALSVTVTQVPEPSTWEMMVVGFAGLGFLSYRASQKRAAAAA